MVVLAVALVVLAFGLLGFRSSSRSSSGGFSSRSSGSRGSSRSSFLSERRSSSTEQSNGGQGSKQVTRIHIKYLQTKNGLQTLLRQFRTIRKDNRRSRSLSVARHLLAVLV